MFAKTVAPFLTALLPLIPLMLAAWLKLLEVLKPLLARRRLRIAFLVADGPEDARCRAFVASLRASGYLEVTLTRSALSCADRAAVVLWQPGQERVLDELNSLAAHAPEAKVLVFTYPFLKGVALGENLLLSQSTLRLRSDLSSLAEARS